MIKMYQRWRRARRMRGRILAIGSLGVGIAIGALAEYFLDPARGRSRRKRFGDQALAAVRQPAKQLQGAATRNWRYVRQRSRGKVLEVAQPPSPPADDVALTDRVRSMVLGDPRYREYTINVDSVDGVVSLRGQVQRPDEIKDLVAAVAQVPGVRQVENFLHPPNTAAPNVSELQKPGERRAPGSSSSRHPQS